jgi:hypothetical protein
MWLERIGAGRRASLAGRYLLWMISPGCGHRRRRRRTRSGSEVRYGIGFDQGGDREQDREGSGKGGELVAAELVAAGEEPASAAERHRGPLEWQVRHVREDPFVAGGERCAHEDAVDDE